MADKPPPPRDEPVGEPVRVNPIPVSMTGDALWKRPDSQDRILRVFQTVRNYDLSYLRVLLESLDPSKLEIDGTSVGAPAGTAPVSIEWDVCLNQNLAWSDSMGVVGPGLIVKHEKKPIAMVQVAAAEVDMETYSMIPSSWYVDKFVPQDSRTGFVLTQRNYFLTYEAMKRFGDPDHFRSISPDERLWYQVSQTSFEFAIERLMARYRS